MEQFSIEPLLSSQNEGEIPASLASELWVKALRQNFGGSVSILPEGSVPAKVHFQNGRAVCFQSSLSPSLARRIIEEHLPPEHLELVEHHASQFEVDQLCAIERLRLVPHDVLLRLHQECMLGQLVQLVELGRKLRFAFREGPDSFRADRVFNQPVETLPLLAECLLQATDLSWHQGRLASRRSEPLKLCGDGLRTDLLLQGLLRQVVTALRRKTETFDSLQAQLKAHEDTLVAVVYALRATGCIEKINQRIFNRPTTAIRFTPPDEGMRPANSVTQAPKSAPSPSVKISERQPSTGIPSSFPAATATSGVRTIDLGAGTAPTPPPPSSARPPISPGPKHTPTPASHLDQHAVESSALAAWMRAMDDKTMRKKALHVVEEANKRFPKNPRILFYLGCLFALNGRRDEAETAMERVLDLDPEHIEARRELAHLQKSEKGSGGSLFRRLTNRRSV